MQLPINLKTNWTSIIALWTVACAQDFHVWEDLQLNQKEDRKCQEEGQAWSVMWRDKEIIGKETRTNTIKHKTKD